MKPFDLEKALAGEPVKLKNGLKAYIIKKLDSSEIGMHELIGFYETEHKRQRSGSWFYNGTRCDDFAITGMWEEPKPKYFVNGIEVPEPVNLDNLKDGMRYWYVDLCHLDNVDCDNFYKSSSSDKKLILQGFVFKSKADAEIAAKALLNYKVEVKSVI